jgi:hypothetical protein
MKTILIALSLFVPFLVSAQGASSPTGPAKEGEAITKTTGIITTHGKTQIEAYNKAKEMLKDGAEEVKVRFSKTGGNHVCRLYWEKD